MTDGDRIALDALNIRLDHTASIALLVARHATLDGDTLGAIEGIAATLNELSGRLEAIVAGPAEAST